MMEETFYEPTAVTAPAMGEAGFSLNWQMLDKDGAAVGVTMRAPHAAGWRDVIEQRAAFVTKATGGGWSFPAKLGPIAPTNPATVAALATPTAPAAPNGHAEPARAHTGDPLFVDVTRVVIAPQLDDRVTLEFYAAGHKFPDVKASKWPVTKATAALKALTSHDFSKPGDFAVQWRVRFTLGKEYGTEGKRYRDIVGIEARE